MPEGNIERLKLKKSSHDISLVQLWLVTQDNLAAKRDIDEERSNSIQNFNTSERNETLTLRGTFDDPQETVNFTN